ncbi:MULTISPECIES: methyltransferase domain-containing protein [unclassified Kitasatospora]|uniref:methyltransferase domain-containing protein n=1 Tax=unclassified Kitasatospora TaxID=2633591 RepID=UPI00070C3CD9|nr:MULTISPECIES: methyltransferase domain-containing protein [unclassified Kitasatospora]KQV15485.1 methyltransferase type 11 [Kitasatospora sp. Root107]KRB63928.1 methyltransferase type 11 [Kitasatospora sp. Root187]
MTQEILEQPVEVPAWDAGRYDSQFGYVSRLAGGVLDLLAPQPGETVLDLGCGTGELAEQIRGRGARVLLVDSDPAMVVAASQRLRQPAVLADGHDFKVVEPVDAVFSNAALHWMTRPEQVIRSVRTALRPGGRFVAEMGGARNVAGIVEALRTALAERGQDAGMRSPWYFPEPGAYAELLEDNGFRVSRIEHFPRETELHDCPEGVVDWLRMFGSALVAHLPEAEHDDVFRRAGELAEPTLRRDGRWYADYWRLRFVAVTTEALSGEPAR